MAAFADNGIKVFSGKGEKFTEELERELRDLYERGSLAMRTKRFFSPPSVSTMPAAGNGGSNGDPKKEAGREGDDAGSQPQEAKP